VRRAVLPSAARCSDCCPRPPWPRVARIVRAYGAGRFAIALPRKARKPGRYTVALSATDAAGNAANAKLRFTVRH
jgi:hypothetical protein